MPASRRGTHLLKASVMRALAVLILVAIANPAFAQPRKQPKQTKQVGKQDVKPEPAPTETPPPRPATPEEAQATALLEKIVAEPAAREGAIAELGKLAPHAMEAIGAWVQRPHATDVAERRKVLAAINAAVPDKSGRFTAPHQTRKERQAEDTADWMKPLLALDPALPGVGEVIADVAAIRALAATRDVRAAQLVFDIAFAEESMIYRDECGRSLRSMEPYSIPALTRESLGKKADRRRYATWQIERIDRQDATKALTAATGNEALQIAILDTFRETRHREAVHAVWSTVDHDAPRVRAAARAAWMEYIVGPAPPPAPKKKLQLPGGKLTKEPKPLYLTYRELADNELRKAANDLLGEDYPIEEQSLDDRERKIKIVPIDLAEVTKRLFAFYDDRRAKRDAEQWQAAKAKSDAGDLVAAASMLDRLIATDPDQAERTAMARIYLAYAKQLEATENWSEAAAAYSKAHGLAPQPTTLAAVHFTTGKALEAAGKDGGAEFRRAVALDPDYAPAKTAADEAASAAAAGRPVWMLYAALGAGCLAMLLFAAAMMRRRAT
jgi:tetratricopeptide (TPR) repeat protein